MFGHIAHKSRGVVALKEDFQNVFSIIAHPPDNEGLVMRQNQTLKDTGGRTKSNTQNTHHRLDLIHLSMKSSQRI